MITAQGDVCEGVWLEGEFSNWGTCWFSNGTVQSGQWKIGELKGFGLINERSNITIGEFQNSKLSGAGLQYVSADEFSVGNWTDGRLAGTGLEFTKDWIRWGNYSSDNIFQERVIKHDEIQVSRFTGNTSIDWPIEPNQVEAIAFKTDKPVSLYAVGVGNSKAKDQWISSIEVRKGNSTTGSVIYSHGKKVDLINAADVVVKILFDRPVFLEAGTFYTLRVQYNHNYRAFAFTGVYNIPVVHGVSFLFEKARFDSDRNIGNHEITSPLSDFYFIL